MSDDEIYDQALAFLLAHEGGYVDHPNDPGGATNYGISLRFALRLAPELARHGVELDIDRDGDIDERDIKALPRATAALIYRRQFWDRYGYHRLELAMARKLFDLAVNMGAPQAHRLAQRALRACEARVVEDGVLGPVTAVAIVGVGPRVFLPALRSEAAGFYRALVAAKPAQFAPFLDGWLNRAYA